MLIVRGQNIKNDFKKTRKLSNDHPTWEAYKNSVLVVFFFFIACRYLLIK
jgi:hypothetical protein